MRFPALSFSDRYDGHGHRHFRSAERGALKHRPTPCRCRYSAPHREGRGERSLFRAWRQSDRARRPRQSPAQAGNGR
jgi:hypothetical protein